jgi:hypothetical protein
MKKFFGLSFAVLLISVTLVLSPAFSEEKKNLQVKKQPEIQQVKPRKPVKIRLKRTGEGKYSWDLTGDDADEMVRTDKRLKKLLNME